MSKAVEIVRAFYDAVSRTDAATLVSLLHADLHWTEAEGFPYYSGTWRRPQEVLDKLLEPLMRDWDNFSAVADDFIVEGDRVVSLGIYSGVNKATGKAMRAPFAHVWRVVDGKLARFDMYTDTLLIHRAIAQRHSDGGDGARISS
jgi:ketosteroid isomerase-like protein